jgi:transcriptional regulator with XRE-family HTH domain
MDGRELLADFLRARPASQAKLARSVGCSEGHISLILKKKRWASPKLAKAISTETAIPAEQLVSPAAREALVFLRAN